MAKTGTGSGDANDASVAVDETPDPSDEARIAQGQAEGVAAAQQVAADDLAAAQAKVEHQKAELAAAEQAVVDAQATLDNLNGD